MTNQKNKKFTFAEEWYFARQDIVSYSISTLIYVALSLVVQFSLQSFLYALFDCLVYYVSFWFIRINFDYTYHSDSWATCKFWTRTMLNTGVFALWILPIRYTMFNGLFVAWACCFVLYLIAVRATHKNIYAMTEQELYEHCRNRGLDDADCKIAKLIVIDRLKGEDLYYSIGYSESQSKRKRKKILNLIK